MQIPASTDDGLTVKDSPVCVMCEFAMSVLEDEIFTNRSLDMVKHGVEMICSYIPGRSVAEKCEDFVQDYGDQIIEIIVSREIQPKEVCKELALCPLAAKMWGEL